MENAGENVKVRAREAVGYPEKPEAQTNQNMELQMTRISRSFGMVWCFFCIFAFFVCVFRVFRIGPSHCEFRRPQAFYGFVPCFYPNQSWCGVICTKMQFRCSKNQLF